MPTFFPGWKVLLRISQVLFAMPAMCVRMPGAWDASPKSRASSLAMIAGPLPDALSLVINISVVMLSDFVVREETLSNQNRFQTLKAMSMQRDSQVCCPAGSPVL